MTKTVRKAAVGTAVGGASPYVISAVTSGGGIAPFVSAPLLTTAASAMGILIFAAPLTTVDAINGALLDIYPNPVDLSLQPSGTLHPDTGDEILAFHIDPDANQNPKGSGSSPE